MDARGLALTIRDERFLLLPERALWWPRRATLLVADLHWGKPETFQRAGIPLPSAVLAEDLARLDAAIALTKPTRVVVLGDLVHHREGLTPRLVATVAAWRARHPDLALVLVRGNHDRHAPVFPKDWRLTVVAGALEEDGFVLTHAPTGAPEGTYVWAGHIHPAAVVAAGGDCLRLPCFVVGTRVGVLPAFSAFTGGAPPPPGRRYAVAGDRVVPLDDGGPRG